MTTEDMGMTKKIGNNPKSRDDKERENDEKKYMKQER